jgi:hypothetical protein
MPQRTCGASGCAKPHRARGLCSSHYNQQYQPDRHRKATVPCGHCGRATLKHASSRYAERYCSLGCRTEAWRKVAAGTPQPWHSAEARGRSHAASKATRSSRRYLAQRKLARAARGTRGDCTWISGRCQRCGEQYTTTTRGGAWPQWCSDTCANRASRSRRRARKRSAVHIPYSRVQVFERDGYRCHLCKRMTKRTAVVPHPKAPVIDHLIPLGPGADAMHNVATACFMCNSKRRDVGAAQLILFG